MAGVHFESIAIAAVGVTLTSAGTSAGAALPVMADGTKARFVRVVASTLAYVKFAPNATPTCTINDILVTTAPSILNVSGQGFFAVLQETAAAKVNVSPVES